MLSFEHTNVMSLIGVCIDGEMPLLIMPFRSNGSVLDFVKHHRDFFFFFIYNKDELFCTDSTDFCMLLWFRSIQ